MSSEIAISAQNLSKCYQIYDKPRDRLLQMFFRGQKQYFREFYAVKDVSFEIKRGETVGIIGRNGSGKSTLLQLLCGTLNPTSGTVTIKGKIAALLELGAGFNPQFTGRENVFLSASLYGLTNEQTAERFEQIVAFADIGEFIDQPVTIYSSGMFVRLAFAVIAHVDADILVVDEALAVGDAYFVHKCMRFLREFTQRGTLLLVSHDTSAVVGLCSKALLMDCGRLDCVGDPKNISEYYLAMLHREQTGSGLANIEMSKTRIGKDNSNVTVVQRPISSSNNDFGTKTAEILSVVLSREDGTSFAFLSGGEVICLKISCYAHLAFPNLLIGFVVRDRLGQVIFGGNTGLSEDSLLTVREEEVIEAEFVFAIPSLQQGDYSVSVAVGEGSQSAHIHHHWVHDALLFSTAPKFPCFGVLATEFKKINISITD